jgi:hypothetical protein
VDRVIPIVARATFRAPSSPVTTDPTGEDTHRVVVVAQRDTTWTAKTHTFHLWPTE